jgi:hypothetical protein
MAEAISAAASVATLVVLTAAAIAALVQLRHMRGSNEIAALSELRETMESQQFQARFRGLLGPFQQRLREPDFRRMVMSEKRLSGIEEFQSAIMVGNFFENAGALVKHRIVDSDLFCDLWAASVIGAWSALEDLIANRGLVTGTYPRLHPRKKLPAPWPEAAEFRKS